MKITSDASCLIDIIIYRGADKSLAGPGRKQATATELLIFASHSKNNSEGCPSNQVSAAAMTYASDEKWRPFHCFFSLVGLRTYQHHFMYM
jgi:glucose/arabinose dehydrogenase